MAEGSQDRHSVEWIDEAGAFGRFIDELIGQPAYGIDTEFHRERTYYPKLALIQIAFAGRNVLIDPLAIDVGPLSRVLVGDGLAVMHAGEQDLEVLEAATGAVPQTIFDTQIAAGFVGLGVPSLGSLCQSALDENLTKGERLTDWLRRPLSKSQRTYAAADVEHLLRLHAELDAQLASRGRSDWAEAEFEALRTKSRAPTDPENAWLAVRDARKLPKDKVGIAVELAAWRETKAMAEDRPPKHVLSDMAIVAIAHRQPKSPSDLASLRGVDERHLKGSRRTEIMDAVRRGVKRKVTKPPRKRRSSPLGELKPAVGLATAWVSQLSRDTGIEASLLATRADVEALFSGADNCRIATGWRSEVLDGALERIIEGNAGLAFERGRGLVLSDRTPNRENDNSKKRGGDPA